MVKYIHLFKVRLGINVDISVTTKAVNESVHTIEEYKYIAVPDLEDCKTGFDIARIKALKIAELEGAKNVCIFGIEWVGTVNELSDDINT